MFDISWGEFLVLIVAGLFILGPERLPGAARWLGRTVRQVREYATGARDQLKSELGSDFEEFREPLEDLRKLRNMDPRKLVTQHLLDGYDPREDLKIDGITDNVKPNGYPVVKQEAQQRPLSPGERPPFDPDAT